ncbi:MAG: sulfotransferase domain-containing protein [Nitrococcus mobilis]|nr:sulfotransferase domain-containing protein [Nitrococcus mobilis]
MAQLPDRYRRAAVIGGTAWLPATLRVRARRTLLGALQRHQARKANVVIIVHPKSGGTWLRVMLFRLFQRKYALPARRVMKTDELQHYNQTLPRFIVSNGHYSYEAAVREVLTNEPADDKQLIFLARHPCDIAVSWHLQFTRRISAAKRELILHELHQPIDYKTIPLWEFVMHPELGLPGLIDYHNQWAEFCAGRDNGLIVRYEDLRADTRATLQRITARLGETFSDAELDEAVEFASFDNLRRLEEANYFHNASLRLQDRNDPSRYKVRRGKVGGFRDDFEPAQAEEMEALVRAHLSPILGYSGPVTPGAVAANQRP